MRGFFSLDGAFYKFGSMLADIIVLSLFWWLFSAVYMITVFFGSPIFTVIDGIPLFNPEFFIRMVVGVPVGAATTALYYVTTRRITNREGYLIREFFKSFKTNFKQATLIWLMIMFVGEIVIGNVNYLPYLDMNPTMRLLLYIFNLVLVLELFVITLYVFVIIARFEMTKWVALRTAFFMVHKHLLTTFTLFVLFLGIFFAGDLYPLFYVIAPGIYALITSYAHINIIKKYRPEIDADPYAKDDFAQRR